MKKFFRRGGKPSDGINENIKIALIALLTGFYLVNDRWLRINFFLGWTAPNPSFSFAIVALVVAGYIMGIKGAVTVAALGQLIGPAFWPMGGPIWPELTFSWMLMGFVFGFFMYRKRNETRVRLAINLAISLIIAWAILTFVNTAFTIYRMDFGSVDWYFTQLFPRGWRYLVQNVVIAIIVFPLLIGLKRPIEKFLIDEEVSEEMSDE